MDVPSLPADYAIDGLALEADRRRKLLGRPYSYGQLIADTTPQQREQIAENYREARINANEKGRYRVAQTAFKLPEKSMREVEDAVCQKIEESMEEAAE